MVPAAPFDFYKLGIKKRLKSKKQEELPVFFKITFTAARSVVK